MGGKAKLMNQIKHRFKQDNNIMILITQFNTLSLYITSYTTALLNAQLVIRC